MAGHKKADAIAPAFLLVPKDRLLPLRLLCGLLLRGLLRSLLFRSHEKISWSVVSPVQSPGGLVGSNRMIAHPVVRSRRTTALFCELLHHDLIQQPSPHLDAPTFGA
jgi:hypothetical protein